jgi:NADH:ubiquinone oxidoreductase subunit 6 (subunit J)
MRGHGAHIWMCGVMVVGAPVVVLATGNAYALLPVVGCVLMMAVMMQMMGGMGGHDHNDRK